MKDLLPHSKFTYYWGLSELNHYLQTQTQGFYHNGSDGFATSVHAFVQKQKEFNQSFVAKLNLRDLQVKHHDDIQIQREKYEQAQLEFNQVWGEYYQKIQKQLQNSEAAIKGISQALERLEGDHEKRISLEEKLQTSIDKKHINQEALQAFHESDDWIELQKIKVEYQQFREIIGLAQAEQALKTYQQKQAQKSHHLGFSFESDAVQCAQQLIIPHLITRQAPQQAPLLRTRIRVLTQVTLQAAQAELDVVIVKLPINPKDSVKVLAVIEAKRNPDDIAEGFIIRQENLAWFSGDQSGYDVVRYRNQKYPQGHFTGGAWHEEQIDGQQYYFDEYSFSYFKRSSSYPYFLDRLYFVSMRRAMSGLSSEQKGLLQHYLSADHRFHDLSEDTLNTLYQVMQNHNHTSMSTYKVLEMYAHSPHHAYQIILLDQKG